MLIVLVTFWNYLVLRNISYIINNEQIILKRGVFNRTTNYMELYRVYDYQKKQSIMETTLGLMNIIVLSRDMSNQKVIFMGISNDDNVIPFIRERVEIEKQRKHIVEFNNPYSGSLV
ncbi:MAG: PH domain-containing protein [Tannerella sp.]|nr:PH domain-containing protein [Tannerella sp.]